MLIVRIIVSSVVHWASKKFIHITAYSQSIAVPILYTSFINQYVQGKVIVSEVFKRVITNDRSRKMVINPESSGCSSSLIFIVLCSNKKERCVHIFFKNMLHDIHNCIKYSTHFECSAFYAVLVLVSRIFTIIKLNTVRMLYIAFCPDNIHMMRLSRLEFILQCVLHQVVNPSQVSHVEGEWIPSPFSCHSTLS